MSSVTRKILTAPLVVSLVLFGLMVSLTSCNRTENPTTEKPVQRTFASPADAGVALREAAKSGDEATLLAMFGPDAKDVLFSGDVVKDKDTLEDFVAAYDKMHRWREIKAGGQMLYVGADNYAFPVPLGQNSTGQWYFDTAAGKDEVLARRIGKDELTAIASTSALADAQLKYFAETHDGERTKQYAQRFVADEGKQNGLYWHIPGEPSPSPLGELGDFARAVGYTNAGNKPQPFDGYYFRILTKQGDKAPGGAKDYIANGKMTGGFAILAYPSGYRTTGIMTFIVGRDGVVYQKDLGEKTADIAAAMADYNPDEGWRPAL
ncbi:MAG: DUF2950 domain-containing protein [Terracidiphilus sp.]